MLNIKIKVCTFLTKIRGLFYDITPGSQVSDFAEKLRTKTQQGTDKASEHYGEYSIIYKDQQGAVST